MVVAIDDRRTFLRRGRQGPRAPTICAIPTSRQRTFWQRYVGRVTKAGIASVKGMLITISKFFNVRRPWSPSSIRRTAKTLQMPERFRGQVIMPHDSDGEHKCTGCTLCEKACPNGTISVLNTKNIAGKKVLGRYIYRYDQCTLCNLCIEACPFDAIRMGHEFEARPSIKDDLIMILNKKEGKEGTLTTLQKTILFYLIAGIILSVSCSRDRHAGCAICCMQRSRSWAACSARRRCSCCCTGVRRPDAGHGLRRRRDHLRGLHHPADHQDRRA